MRMKPKKKIRKRVRIGRVVLMVIAVITVTVALPLIIIKSTCGFYKQDGAKPELPAYPDDSAKISVYIKKEDRVAEMTINEYLTGVVAAEIPVEFNEEAIKAQAVAARSYLMSHMESYKKSGTPEAHKGADACTDHTHCQAWMSEADRRAAWNPADADKNWIKLENAVLSTSGEVMVYNGSVINAVFHSTSSGKTESAKSVWGSDVPYLQSVDSSLDAESPKYSSSADMTAEEYKKTMETALGALDWSKGLWSDIVYSSAGGIETMQVGGKTIKGTRLREIFSLRSTNVRLSESGGSVHMEVHGYGHGVGMSQYGANYLAAEGKDYKQILKTYYTGIELAKK